MRQQLLDKEQSFQERLSPLSELTENKEREMEKMFQGREKVSEQEEGEGESSSVPLRTATSFRCSGGKSELTAEKKGVWIILLPQ